MIVDPEPSSAQLASGAPFDVDLAHLEPGSQKVIQWRGLPVFLVQRTPKELEVLRNSADTALLSDPESSVLQQPSYAKNWHRSIKPEYLVLVGICTHLGCVLAASLLGAPSLPLRPHGIVARLCRLREAGDVCPDRSA
jgi:ubiquinol-cytochrome c reductase iron-sulfur subunit